MSSAPTPTLTITLPNPEAIIQSSQLSYGVFYATTCFTDSVLYNSYNVNDLRKTVFFKAGSTSGTYFFRGQYSSSTYEFIGIAVDEMYLTRAECYARLGNTGAAMNDLNTLMIKRWKNTVPYPTFTATNADDALIQILTERRKELLVRGIRWTDLRRLNQDSRFAKTLTRVLNGVTYTLPPNDPRYTLLIPLDEIQLQGEPQNPR